MHVIFHKLVAAVYTFQLQTFYLKRTVNKEKIRKCKKQGIKNLLVLYYIQAKCRNTADKNPNAADEDEQIDGLNDFKSRINRHLLLVGSF